MKGLFKNLQEAASPVLWMQIAFLIALPYHTHIIKHKRRKTYIKICK